MSRGGIWNSWTSDSNGVFRFLSKKEKIKEKKKKKKSELSSSNEDETTSADTKDSNSIDLPMNGADSDQPILDEEGYIIRPSPTKKPVSDNHFYSSSDPDSEEEEEKDHKIRIKINPITNGVPISASVEELIASAGTLSLSPITQHSSRRIYTTSTGQPSKDAPMKRSISVNHNISKTENDLLSVFSPLSSASFSLGLTDQNQTNCKNHSSNYKLNLTSTSQETKPTADRYAALSDLFSEPSNESPTLPKSMSASILGPPLLTSIPRPPSKRNPQTSPQLCHQNSQANAMSRCQSATSLSSDFKMTSISGYSRGPSPITLGISDTIPIAIALQESVSACFKGIDETKCRVQVVGCLKMAFPAGIVQALTSNPYIAPLTFRLNKSSKLEKMIPNKELLSNATNNNLLATDSTAFEVNMSALLSNIRRLYEQSPNSRYYNIDLLKYQMRCIEGAKNTPLQLVSYWKCEPSSTCLKVDYKLNGSVVGQSHALRNVTICVNVDGQPHSMKCRPEGKWNAITKQAIWRFEQISKESQSGGLGSIKAKFDLSSGPSKPSAIQAQFSCSDATLTGLEFELTAIAYRVSLVKKQIFSGRYVCEP